MSLTAKRGPHGSDNPLPGRVGGQRGFSTTEMVTATALFGVVMASAAGLLMSQRSLYETQADRIAVQMNVRAAVDLVAREIRTVPAGGIVEGRADSVVVRYPYRWGLVCGYANKEAASKDPDDPPPPPAPDAELYMPPPTDPLFQGHPQSGIAFRDTTGAWVYVDDGDEPWEPSLYVESLLLCREGPGQKVEGDRFDKEGNLIEAGDTAGPNYRRWTGYYEYTGQEAYRGAQVIAYSEVTYRFGPSEFEPGTRALYRITSQGALELSGLFDEDAGFEYVLQNGSVRSDLQNQNHRDRLVEIRINAFGKKASREAADGAVDYDAVVSVVLRNGPDATSSPYRPYETP